MVKHKETISSEIRTTNFTNASHHRFLMPVNILFLLFAHALVHALALDGMDTNYIKPKRKNLILIPLPQINQPHLEMSHSITTDFNASTYHEIILKLEKEIVSLRVQFPLVSEVPMKGNQRKEATPESMEFNAENYESKPLSPLMALFFVACAVSMRNTVMKIHRWRQNKKLTKEILEQDDIAYAASPSNFDYGSFSSPWTGDLAKFDV